MKLVGFTGYDFNVNQLESLGAVVNHLGVVKSSLIATPYNAYIAYGSYDDTRYRPYLVLDTEIKGAIGDFSNGITEFRYRDDDKLLRAVNYDFTDDELSVLVSKGLYNKDFEVPALFTDTDFEIPIDLDIYLVNVNDKTMIYASYDMISDLKTNSKESEYDLVQYFDKQVQDTYDFDLEDDYDETYLNQFENENENENELEQNQGDYELTPDKDAIVTENNLDQNDVSHETNTTIDYEKLIDDNYHVKTAVEEFNSINLNDISNNYGKRSSDEMNIIKDKETVVEKHERENHDNFEDVTKDLDKGHIDTELMKQGSSLSPEINQDDPEYT